MSENASRAVTRVALFDFDMTLMDTSHVITECTNMLADKFRLRRVTLDEMRALIGYTIEDTWIALWGRFEEEWLIYYRKNIRGAEHAGFREFPDTRPSMLRLREKGIKTGVVSNRTYVGAVLQQLGLAGLFDVAVGLEDVKNAKPHPEPVLTALSRLSATPCNAFYVGDTEIDMKTSVAAGVTGIGVTTGHYDASALVSAGGAVACPNLTGVADVILRSVAEDR
jgi:HAD superfamily hydrolase (TIGR01549 family)